MLRKCFHWLGLTACHLLSEHSFLNERGESERRGGKKEEAAEIRGNSWRREVKLRRWDLHKVSKTKSWQGAGSGLGGRGLINFCQLVE